MVDSRAIERRIVAQLLPYVARHADHDPATRQQILDLRRRTSGGGKMVWTTLTIAILVGVAIKIFRDRRRDAELKQIKLTLIDKNFSDQKIHVKVWLFDRLRANKQSAIYRQEQGELFGPQILFIIKEGAKHHILYEANKEMKEKLDRMKEIIKLSIQGLTDEQITTFLLICETENKGDLYTIKADGKIIFYVKPGTGIYSKYQHMISSYTETELTKIVKQTIHKYVEKRLGAETASTLVPAP